jgi:sec-independent protein translocase protein TatA
MFGLGLPEMILILVVALLIFGPKKMPDLARSLGRAVREFRSAMSEMERSVKGQLADEDEVGLGKDSRANASAAEGGVGEGEKKGGGESKDAGGKAV